MKVPLDPMRFRANLYFDTGTPWEEFDWCDRQFQIGDVEVRGLARIERCAATNVNLESASRDVNIPLQLQKAFGHSDMGIYLDVVSAGTIKPGDTVTPPG